MYMSELEIPIPESFLELLKWKENDQLEMSVEDGRLVITKVNQSAIEKLFEGYEGDYQPSEFDWGEKAGVEAW